MFSRLPPSHFLKWHCTSKDQTTAGIAMVRPVVRRPCGGGRARRGTAPTPIRILLDAARSFVPPARSPLVTPSYTVILSACHALRDQRGAGGHACQQQNVPALCRPVQRTWSSLSLSLSLCISASLCFSGSCPLLRALDTLCVCRRSSMRGRALCRPRPGDPAPRSPSRLLAHPPHSFLVIGVFFGCFQERLGS